MRALLQSLKRRLTGGVNPYAGYVEACAETVAHWGLKTDAPGYRLRHYYTDSAFSIRVDKTRQGVR